jgi:hypothetical protein
MLSWCTGRRSSAITNVIGILNAPKKKEYRSSINSFLYFVCFCNLDKNMCRSSCRVLRTLQ